MFLITSEGFRKRRKMVIKYVGVSRPTGTSESFQVERKSRRTPEYRLDKQRNQIRFIKSHRELGVLTKERKQLTERDFEWNKTPREMREGRGGDQIVESHHLLNSLARTRGSSFFSNTSGDETCGWELNTPG